MPAAFEPVVVLFQVMCVNRLVVLGCDATACEFLGNVVERWMVIDGSLFGPGSVDPKLQEVAGQRFCFEGLVGAVEDSLAGEVRGEFGGGWFLFVLVLEVLPGQEVAVHRGQAVLRGCCLVRHLRRACGTRVRLRRGAGGW